MRKKIYTQLKKSIGIILVSFMVPSAVVFGFSVIDLGLMHYDASATSGATAQVESATSSESGTESSNDSSTTSESSINVETGQVSEREIIIDQGENVGTAETVTRPDPFEVDSEIALVTFAQEFVSSDHSIKELVITDDEVQLTYEQQGELFAFITVTYDITATVHRDGEVEVDYPWYEFLIQDSSSLVETQLELAVSTTLGEQEEITNDDEEQMFTAREAAQIASQMHIILEAILNASTDSSSGE